MSGPHFQKSICRPHDIFLSITVVKYSLSAIQEYTRSQQKIQDFRKKYSLTSFIYTKVHICRPNACHWSILMHSVIVVDYGFRTVLNLCKLFIKGKSYVASCRPFSDQRLELCCKFKCSSQHCVLRHPQFVFCFSTLQHLE